MTTNEMSGRSAQRRSSGHFPAQGHSNAQGFHLSDFRQTSRVALFAAQSTAAISLVVVLAWLLLRPRDWPNDSAGDWGGIALLGLASVVAWTVAPRKRRSLLPVILVPITAMLLIGHVGSITAVFGLVVSVVIAIALAIGLALRVSAKVSNQPVPVPSNAMNRVAAAPRSEPRALARPSSTVLTSSLGRLSDDVVETIETTNEPEAGSNDEGESEEIENEQDDECDASNEDASDEDESDENGSDESDESDLPQASQQWTRFSTPTGEQIVGRALVEVLPGQQTTWLHLPCWPPLVASPVIELSTDDSGARAKATLAERHGFRIELRMDRAVRFARQVTIEFRVQAGT